MFSTNDGEYWYVECFIEGFANARSRVAIDPRRRRTGLEAKMIQSMFIITSTGEIIIEKHWRGITNRTVCDFFVEEVNKYKLREDVPPVIATSKHYFISVFREGLFLLAVVTNEIAPLFVIEFLHRVVAVFRDYFGSFEESAIKDNFSTVYQLLEEMLDNGYPLTTEPNALKAMVAPPSTVNRIAAIVSSRVSDQLPDGAISNIPWRKAGVKYTQNEIYFDVVEEIDAIVDSHGQMLSCEVSGTINGHSRLSGVPDLTMVFVDPSVIDDCSFHPSPCRVRASRSAASDVVAAEDITVQITFPKSVRTVDANTDSGSCLFDDSTKTLKWTVGKFNPKKVLSPSLKGSIVLQHGAATPDEKPIVLLGFKVPFTTVSGLAVETLVLTNENYKPYKGVRTLTQAGRFQIRT
ncbi:hypothetical protein DYB32_007078 [Aphanomyces invadans]|uniref:MHD domain-containing protein n=1 Tax=Aphanomyces invadans TaxID=157072 RepID=A0A418APQ6_9STRA|nr:hypothetical protein DYB32_007078 [Aphanomyces invadans]